MIDSSVDRYRFREGRIVMRGFLAVTIAVASILGGEAFLWAQEPPAYIIAKLTITDQDGYGAYRAGFGEVFQQYGGEIVAVSTAPTVLEGEWDATTTVIIRFESRTEALAWYNSDTVDRYTSILRSCKAARHVSGLSQIWPLEIT